MSIRLGINIDHVATLRNARGGSAPDPVRAARIAVEAGADLITAHLREDRRHIRDEDIKRLMTETGAPLNMEMAVTKEMESIALAMMPHAVCLVPERRTEITTEGGLDVAGNLEKISACVKNLRGIKVSLFIAADEKQVMAAVKTGAPAIEIHTGAYANAVGAMRDAELKRIHDAAMFASSKGLAVHAGHGLDYENVMPVAAIAPIEELNIGHFLMGEALFVGMRESVSAMKKLMLAARKKAAA